MIANQTHKAVLASSVVHARSLLSQAFGLMFRKKLVDTGWVFSFFKEGSWDITNLFVFQDIDVLWLDAKKIVRQKKTISSFTFHVSGIKGTKFVIELPAGAAKRVQLGDRISWSDPNG